MAGLLAGIVLLTVVALAVTTGLYRNATREARRAQKAEKSAETEAQRAQKAEKSAEKDRDNAREQEAAARKAERVARKQEELARQEKERAEEQLTRAEGLLYASQIQAAQLEWEAGNTAMAWEHLDSTRWDYRNVEYRYLFTLLNQNHVTLKHTGGVYSLALSSDGTRIVSGSFGQVEVWDARSGRILLLLGHTGSVMSVAPSSDGTRIVSGSSDCTVKVWDARSGKNLLTLKGHTGYVYSVAISSDGTRIVSGGKDKTVKLWDGSARGKDLLHPQGAHTAGAQRGDQQRWHTHRQRQL